jgi:hypothetical protein
MGDKARTGERIAARKPDHGPSWVLLAWLFVVALLCVVSGISLYRLDLSAGPTPIPSYSAAHAQPPAGHSDP